jgi:hypothetical protein
VLRPTLLALAALALSGCLDVCARAKLLNEQFQKRHDACFPDGALPNAPFDEKRCDASMKVCNPTEEQTIQKYFDCLDQLPVCTKDTKAAFNDAFLKCAAPMSSLSAGCFRP